MKKIVTIPTLVGILFLIAGIATGVILVQGRQIFRIGASPETSPKDVRVTNITDSSFTVSWITDTPTAGFIKYGTSSLTETALDEIEGKSTTHFVTAKNLEAETVYSLKANSEGLDFDIERFDSIKTGTAIGSPESTIIISGTVQNETGTASPNSLVYIQMAGGSPLSAFTSSDGNWLLALSSSRTTPTLNSYTTIDLTQTMVEIFIQAPDGKTASAKVLPQSARPVPTIVLGQVHDFTNIETSGEDNIPQSLLNLPTDDAISKFVVEEATSSGEAPIVTLESHKEGEVVTTTTPEFFGEGPAGTSITITVESDPVTEVVSVSAKGDWKWEPPKDLAPGSHKITISWRDIQGILRTLTRNFVVSAAEGPSFEASSSATTTPTPSATATATPSSTVSPTSIASPSGTTVPLPVSGSLTPTITLFIMGVGVVLFSVFVALIAF